MGFFSLDSFPLIVRDATFSPMISCSALKRILYCFPSAHPNFRILFLNKCTGLKQQQRKNGTRCFSFPPFFFLSIQTRNEKKYTRRCREDNTARKSSLNGAQKQKTNKNMYTGFITGQRKERKEKKKYKRKLNQRKIQIR